MISGSEVEWVSPEKFKSIEELKEAPGDFYMVHLYPEVELARFFDPKQFAKIVLIRDPKDVMISFLHHIAEKKKWVYSPQFDHQKFVSLSFDEKLRETLLFHYPNPLSCLPYAVAWMSDPSVFVCRFEDLVGEKGGGTASAQQTTLLALASFIGHPIESKRAAEIGNALFGETWTFRAGQIGSGEKVYNTENKLLFQKLVQGMMKDLGYQETW